MALAVFFLKQLIIFLSAGFLLDVVLLIFQLFAVFIQHLVFSIVQQFHVCSQILVLHLDLLCFLLQLFSIWLPRFGFSLWAPSSYFFHKELISHELQLLQVLILIFTLC